PNDAHRRAGSPPHHPACAATLGAARNAGRCSSQTPCSDEMREPWAQLATVRSVKAQGTKWLTPSGTPPRDLLMLSSLCLISDMTLQRPSIAKVSVGMVHRFHGD